MAGDSLYAGLLLGLGFDELSITPALLPEVKYLIREIKSEDAVALAEEALQLTSAEEIHQLLDAFRKKHLEVLMDW